MAVPTLLHKSRPLNAPSDRLLVAQLRIRHEGFVQPRAEVGRKALRVIFAQVEELYVGFGALFQVRFANGPLGCMAVGHAPLYMVMTSCRRFGFMGGGMLDVVHGNGACCGCLNF